MNARRTMSASRVIIMFGLIPLLLAANAARAEIVTSGIKSSNQDGVWMTLGYASIGGHKLWAEPDSATVVVPVGAEMKFTLNASGPSAGWAEGSYLSGVRINMHGDEYRANPGVSTFEITQTINSGWMNDNPIFVTALANYKVLIGWDEGPPRTPIYREYNIGYTLKLLRPLAVLGVKLPGEPDSAANWYSSNWYGGNSPNYVDRLDSFNVSFVSQVNCVSLTNHESWVVRPGALARVHYNGINYVSPWQTTGASGITTITMGSGGPLHSLAGETHAPDLYLCAEPLTEDGTQGSSAYITMNQTLPDHHAFTGPIRIQASDIDGHPIRARVTAWGGPMFQYDEVSKLTDASGAATLDIITHSYNGGDSVAGSEDVPFYLPPWVKLEGLKTQVLDGYAFVIEDKPYFLSPAFELLGDAYTYAKDKSMSCKEARIQFLDDADSVIHENIVHPGISDRPYRNRGRGRYYYEIDPPATQTRYRARVVFKDRNPHSTGGDVTASPTVAFYVQATHEVTNEPFNVCYRVCAVGAWTGQPAAFYEDMLTSTIAIHDVTMGDILPFNVAPARGEVYNPGPGYYLPSIWCLKYLACELNALQKVSPGIDRIVAIVPPNFLDTSEWIGGKCAGLAFGLYDGAVLIDPSKTKKGGALHEFGHTLGLDDLYEGDYLGLTNVAPPSGNGYSSRRRETIYNEWGQGAFYQAVMFDFADDPWVNALEFGAIVNFFCESLIAKPAPAKGRFAAAPQTVISLSGAFKENSQVTLDPVFTREGRPVNPYAGKTNGDYYIRIIDQNNISTVVYLDKSDLNYHVSPSWGETANQASDNRVLTEAGIKARFAIQLPWNKPIKQIQLGHANSIGGMIGIWYTATASASAPVVTALRPAPGVYQGSMALRWKSADADPPLQLLGHEVATSADGGATWQTISRHADYDWATGEYSLTIDTRDFPTGSNYAFRILASDGLRTGSAIFKGYTLKGYAPNPQASLDAASWSGSRKELGTFVIPLGVRNRGYKALTLAIDRTSLPAWMSQTSSETVIVSPQSAATLQFAGTALTTGTFAATIKLKTNDPARPTINYPISMTIGGAVNDPSVMRVTLNPDYPAIRPWQPGERVRIEAWAGASRPGLNATITIESVAPAAAILAAGEPMEESAVPGKYIYEWVIPETAGDGRYGIKINLEDPLSGKRDANGVVAAGYDATLVVRRFNRAPVFTQPEGEVTSVTLTVGKMAVFTYAVSDPDGDAIDLTASGLNAMQWDRAARKIQWMPTRAYGDRPQLVLSARDGNGALAAHTWDIHLVDNPNPPPANQAQPDFAAYALLNPAGTFGISQWVEGQQGCRVDTRKAGMTVWTKGPVIAYTKVTSYLWRREWKAGLGSATAYEVRCINIDGQGREDASAPVIPVFTSGVAGTVTAIVAPACVLAGQAFTLKITARNDSYETWNSGSGHRVAPAAGDPFFSAPIGLTLWQSATHAAAVTWAVPLKAPATAGVYTTKWSLVDGTGKTFGSALSTQVNVVADPGVDATALRSYLLGLWTPTASWLAAADVNHDGKLNVSDLLWLMKLSQSVR